MVPLLTPQQIESNFAQRLAEAEDEVQRLQAAIAEVVPAPPADAAQAIASRVAETSPGRDSNTKPQLPGDEESHRLGDVGRRSIL